MSVSRATCLSWPGRVGCRSNSPLHCTTVTSISRPIKHELCQPRRPFSTLCDAAFGCGYTAKPSLLQREGRFSYQFPAVSPVVSGVPAVKCDGQVPVKKPQKGLGGEGKKG